MAMLKSLVVLVAMLLILSSVVEGRGGQRRRVRPRVVERVQEVGEVLCPAVGNWIVGGQDLRAGVDDMPRSNIIGMRIIMYTLVLMVAFRRASPGMPEECSMIVGVIAEHILRRVQPFSTDVTMTAAIIRRVWAEFVVAVGVNRNGDRMRFLRMMFQGVNNGVNDPRAPQAVPADQMLPLLEYLVDFVDRGLDSDVPFPVFMFNPFG